MVDPEIARTRVSVIAPLLQAQLDEQAWAIAHAVSGEREVERLFDRLCTWAGGACLECLPLAFFGALSFGHVHASIAADFASITFSVCTTERTQERN